MKKKCSTFEIRKAEGREFSKVLRSLEQFIETVKGQNHGLRTPNEGINQRNLNIWADVADKICFG